MPLVAAIGPTPCNCLHKPSTVYTITTPGSTGSVRHTSHVSIQEGIRLAQMFVNTGRGPEATGGHPDFVARELLHASITSRSVACSILHDPWGHSVPYDSQCAQIQHDRPKHLMTPHRAVWKAIPCILNPLRRASHYSPTTTNQA